MGPRAAPLAAWSLEKPSVWILLLLKEGPIVTHFTYTCHTCLWFVFVQERAIRTVKSAWAPRATPPGPSRTP